MRAELFTIPWDCRDNDKKMKDKRIEDEKIEDKKIKDEKIEDNNIEDNKIEDNKIEHQNPLRLNRVEGKPKRSTLSCIDFGGQLEARWRPPFKSGVSSSEIVIGDSTFISCASLPLVQGNKAFLSRSEAKAGPQVWQPQGLFPMYSTAEPRTKA
jgi:hypothetical protein